MAEVNSFTGHIDKVFRVAEPAIPGEGEDGYYCCRNDKRAIVAVFDGCGGLGSRRYTAFNGHTGAYISSRIASGAAHDCFHLTGKMPDKSGRTFYTEYIKLLEEGFSMAADMCSHEQSMIRGALVRDFPCTAAMAYVSSGEGGVTVDCMWAGDSRVYLLNRNGLQQMTVDDLDVSDAMENLSADSALKNVLSSDGRYMIHRRIIRLNNPGIVFAATDGCFGYMNSPMEFEYALIGCLVESDTQVVFEEKMHDVFMRHAQDDFTFGGIVIGFSSFDDMRKNYEKRYEQLRKEYIDPIRKAEDADTVRRMLWEQYRGQYEHFIKGI